MPALYQINTGMPRPGFPSAGSWVTYGLGSENQNLPGFVVLGNTQGVKGGPLNWSSGFLPTTYQGTLFRSEGNPILNLQRPNDVRAERSAGAARFAGASSTTSICASTPAKPDLAARIDSRSSWPIACRRKRSNLVDFSSETREPRGKMYGLDDPKSRSFGTKCLMARRLVERGVRFVQVYSDGEWDAHGRPARQPHRPLRRDRRADRRPADRSQTAAACWIRRW